MITQREIKAARSFFGWSRQELADQCGLSLNSIVRLETGEVAARTDTVMAVRKVFERNGILFLSLTEGEEGIRYRGKSR